MIRNLPLFAMIALLTGCAFGPGPGAGDMPLSDGHYSVYGYLGNNLHFLIVSDSAFGSFGCSSNVLLGPGWTGSIKPVNASQTKITYKVGKHSVRIGDEKYKLGEGRYFVVSTAMNAPVIQQLTITPRELVENIVKADKRFGI